MLIRRITAMTLGVTLAAGLGLAAGVGVTVAGAPQAAHAASSVGGQISRDEIMSRAQYWYDNRGSIPYSQSGWYRDQGGKDYRTDCSGYVSMAWHLSASAWTGNLGKVATQISKTSLLPGDALNSPAEHVILFKRWINQSTGTFEYYSFGSTPVKIATDALTGGSDGLIDSHPASNYVALRYRNVIGSGETPVRDPWIADVTGDGFHDLVATKSDGSMWLFSNNYIRDGATPYGDVRQIGSGWGNYERVINADANGDGFADMLGIKADGTMWLFSNNFARDGGAPYGDVRQIGSGWGNYTRIIAADANGDGFTDLLGIKADGTMWLFSNNFARDGGAPYGDVRQIGSGWGNYTRIIAADANGDGFTDLLGIKADGTMWLFSNNYTRDGAIPYGDVRQIGSGWGNYTRIIAADANGDGFTDLLGIKADGTMWLFSNNYTRDGAIPYGDVRQIGSGWGG
ncbi:FG-GAP-like repeat-containing protein, partial [Micromonospora aurantiaca (nom. illeg.)]|uniref:FG-GAP-like repeat-containing protein n=2 Tax=Micromonospora aurantiaca (nom. illeg.) TaxID=47850 RepID=UPI00340E5211